MKFNLRKSRCFIIKFHHSQKAHTRLCEKNTNNDILWNYHHVVWCKQYQEKRVLTRSERSKIYKDSVKFGVGGVSKLKKKYVNFEMPPWVKI